MPKPEDAPFDPHAFAAGVVPPKDPYKGYDARQAELAESKDHPWVQPAESENSDQSIGGTPETSDAATRAREAFVEYATEEFRLTGPDTRTDVERENTRKVYVAGRKAVEAALAAAKAKPKEQ